MSTEPSPDMKQLLTILGDVARGNLGRRLPVPAETEPLRPLIEAFNTVLDAWRRSEVKARAIRRELQEKLGTIEAQAAAIRELSTPVLEVREDTLLVPVVGALSPQRGADLGALLLPEIKARATRYVILDITGVGSIDSASAAVLVGVVRSARLLGARCVITGVRPQAAISLVSFGTDLNELLTVRSLQEGMRYCSRLEERARQAPVTAASASQEPGPLSRNGR